MAAQMVARATFTRTIFDCTTVTRTIFARTTVTRTIFARTTVTRTICAGTTLDLYSDRGLPGIDCEERTAGNRLRGTDCDE